MGQIQPIPTTYKGYRFRSRLEARWAVFFDVMGIKYEYEPEGFSMDYGIRYLPDFALHNVLWRGQNAFHYTGKPGSPVFVEVKGADRYSDIPYKDRIKMEMFASSYPLLILGNIPEDVCDEMQEHSGDGIMNYRFLDGDSYPCFFSKHDGNIWLCGPDHEEFHPWTTDEAITIAKMSRFEYGESPVTERI